MACQPRRLLAVAVAVAAVLTLATTLLASPSTSTNTADSLSFGSSFAGNETLISNSSVFELGFFTPEGGSGTYLGIWYHGIPEPTIVWVANRYLEVRGPWPPFKCTKLRQWSVPLAGGQLQVVDGNTVLWSSSAGNVTGSAARLLDTGNFVIIVKNTSSDDDESISWQSFDHPTDTLLPGMQLGLDLQSGVSTSLTARTSVTDPSPGQRSLISLSLAPASVTLFALLRFYPA
ncbi:S-locus-specific glycoprotein S13-like [Panicum virgatum]|uniref:S-locus-specific glycoprotein S13-like n=1 Tax=Panicum virgatum TaxID=38727 RepID=UPI0019D673A3|nr:S-locus-specific glycoprotein S13-like [Panicum virgatum]